MLQGNGFRGLCGSTPPMRWTWIALGLMLAGSLTPIAAGNGQTHEVTVVAREDGCPDGKTFCFEVTEGDLSSLTPGDKVNVTFQNEGSLGHELYFARTADADSSHEDTGEDAAFARIEETSPGASKQKTIRIPTDADGLYIWCDVSGHESQGMWESITLASSDGGGTSTDGDQQGSPLGLWIAAVGLVGAALIARRRR